MHWIFVICPMHWTFLICPMHHTFIYFKCFTLQNTHLFWIRLSEFETHCVITGYVIVWSNDVTEDKNWPLGIVCTCLSTHDQNAEYPRQEKVHNQSSHCALCFTVHVLRQNDNGRFWHDVRDIPERRADTYINLYSIAGVSKHPIDLNWFLVPATRNLWVGEVAEYDHL